MYFNTFYYTLICDILEMIEVLRVLPRQRSSYNEFIIESYFTTSSMTHVISSGLAWADRN